MAVTNKNAFMTADSIVKAKYRTKEGEPLKNVDMMQLLNCSHAWYFKCLSEGTTSLPMALKLDILTDGEVKWTDLCPANAKEDILAVKDKVVLA